MNGTAKASFVYIYCISGIQKDVFPWPRQGRETLGAHGIEPADSVSDIEYIISTAPFERLLLGKVADRWLLEVDSFGQQDDDSLLLQYLFNQRSSDLLRGFF